MPTFINAFLFFSVLITTFKVLFSLPKTYVGTSFPLVNLDALSTSAESHSNMGITSGGSEWLPNGYSAMSITHNYGFGMGIPKILCPSLYWYVLFRGVSCNNLVNRSILHCQPSVFSFRGTRQLFSTLWIHVFLQLITSDWSWNIL